MIGSKPIVITTSAKSEATGVAGRGFDFWIRTVAVVVPRKVFVHNKVATTWAGFSASATEFNMGSQVSMGHLKLTVLA